MKNEFNKAKAKVTEAIEEHTAKKHSSCYLLTATLIFGTAMFLKCMKKKHAALFVGQWAAPILLLGIYNKIGNLKHS